MRNIPIEYAREGDILGKTLYNNMGSMLLKEGTMLTTYMIKKLRSFGYLSLIIKDEYSDEEIEEVIKPEIMSRIYTLQNDLQASIATPKIGTKVDGRRISKSIKELDEIVNEITHDIVTNKNILGSLASISVYDDYTLNHSLNMMMLSLVMGRHADLNMEELKLLATGCLFHDIGKIFLPIEIVNKPGGLTEEEFMLIQSHVEKGYDFLKEFTDLSAVARNITLCHHEREDGSGYPRQLKGDEIHKFSKIASICDVFDALTSDRIYRRAVSHYEAYEYLLAMGGSGFDIGLIETFAQSINIFPKGTLVYLSDRREGVVCEVNPGLHTRPRIKVYGEKGKKVTPYIIDLSEINNLVIERTLHIFSFDEIIN